MTANRSLSAEAMAAEARRWLDDLDEDQRARAWWPFPSDEERTRWFYTPTEHGGLSLVDCGPAQRQAAMRLLAAGLSPAGYAQVTAIMGHELILERLEGWHPVLPAWGRPRDPLRYALSIFGEPESHAWAWRFAGHHLSLHYTIIDGTLASPTPGFIGVDPAESSMPAGSVLRPCGAMEDLGRQLVRSLDDRQRAVAVVAAQAPPDIVTGNRAVLTDGLWVTAADELFRDAERFPGQPIIDHVRARHRADEAALDRASVTALRWSRTPVGLPWTMLQPAQRDLLSALIGAYMDRLPDDAIQAEYSNINDSSVHFAWAGDTEPRRPHYYRVQGSRMLLEYDNSQRDANHIHTVWRDLDTDFGGDLLTAHYAAHH